MGCDGGTIPKRCELVPEKKKKEKKDKNMSRIARWSNCAISHQKLAIPVVSCRKGLLMNKDAVIENILNKNRNFSHVKKLKDVKELSMHINPYYKESNHTDVEIQTISQFVCPISGLEMNGKYKFVFFWSCGCVISKRALDEIKTSTCAVCNQPYNADDVIEINPPEPEEESIPEPVVEFKKVKKAKDTKKSDKSKNIIRVDSEAKEKRTDKHRESSLSKPVVCMNNGSTDFDPKSTQVYKSLFISGDKYKNKPNDKKAYWVSTFSYSV
ncbi:Protein RTF2 [Thelohanellus kitauei]|uniref:Replication termination factor 2 n=1 Tax=Thelohanellus kitauei TaxID=669202 RepID=A0A0C2J111_THEKT|nr:Protein RTF2 [Thelohanellus kitauei]